MKSNQPMRTLRVDFGVFTNDVDPWTMKKGLMTHSHEETIEFKTIEGYQASLTYAINKFRGELNSENVKGDYYRISTDNDSIWNDSDCIRTKMDFKDEEPSYNVAQRFIEKLKGLVY